MKKSRVLICVVSFSFALNISVYAQQYFFLGAAGGAFTNLPTDVNTQALADYVHSSYHKYMYTQNNFGAISPIASAMLGYGSKHFSLQTGIEAMFNINENLLVINPTSLKTTAIINYTYSSLNLPLILRFYAGSEKFKFGLMTGVYFSFPLGDTVRNMEGPTNFFNKTSVVATRINETKDIVQDITGGVRLGLVAEIGAGNGAFIFEIGYQRELFSAGASMNLEAAINDGKASVSNTERKITILSGPRVMIGYKHKFMFKSSGQPAPVINQPVVSTETPAPAAVPAVDAKLFDSARYYMIVAELTEGPFAFSDIASLIGRGLLTKESMLWKKGMINWEPAANFQELSPLFSTAP